MKIFSRRAGESTPLTKSAYDGTHEWVVIVWDKGIFFAFADQAGIENTMSRNPALKGEESDERKADPLQNLSGRKRDA